ncbi:hypothetical protein Tco_1060078 [Tanacetum coccineum]
MPAMGAPVEVAEASDSRSLPSFHLPLYTNYGVIDYTPNPSRKIRRICACTSPETTKNQRAIRRIQKTLYAVSKIEYLMILEDIERDPYSKKLLIRRIDLTQYGVSKKFQTL